MRKRTNIYLDESQHQLLGLLARIEDRSVAEVVREAVDAWIVSKGLRKVPEDEWGRRFDAIMARRAAIARKLNLDPDEVEREVLKAVHEVRRARRARRR